MLFSFEVHRAARRGGVTPLVILSLALLLGVVAIAVDGGSLLEERRHAQATADAAALAAAADLLANFSANGGSDPNGTAAQSALTVASANGYGNDGVQSIVTVNVSPQNYQGGPQAGTPLPAGYAEVIVQYNASRKFSNIFGSGAVPVRARAVARGSTTSQDGIILLGLNQPQALGVSGGAQVNVTGGSVRVNSNSSAAIGISGQAQVSASSYNLVSGAGGASSSGLRGPNGSAPIINYGGQIPDPLRSLTPPDPAQLGLQTRGTNLQVGGQSVVDLYPGVYNRGIQVSDQATVILHTNPDGSPGIYYINTEGLSISGQATVRTAANETGGVMIYNVWTDRDDGITVSGQGSLSLVPPSAGPYKGLSIFQQRGSPTQSGPPLTLSGQGKMNVTGTIYAAYSSMTISGQASDNVMGGQYIVDSLTVSGQGTVNVNPSNQPVAATRRYGLVE
jgi:hypothetical protein